MTDNEKAEISKLRAAGQGYGRIAQSLGISVNTIKSFCRRSISSESRQLPAVGGMSSCENCGKDILQVQKQKKKRFCCDKCRNQWWNSHLELVKRKAMYEIRCPRCQKVFQVYGDRRRKYCSHGCYIEDRFKGGAVHG